MTLDGSPPEVSGAGEYGASTVYLTKDGQALRLAFGRNGANGKVFYAAVLLTAEAAAELKTQIANLDL